MGSRQGQSRQGQGGDGVIVHDCLQRSDEWRQLRVGKLTGTCAADMLATIKSGEAAARRDLRMRLVVERLTGQSQDDGYVNAVMQRGIDLEPVALSAYEAITGQMVQRVGFLEHASLPAGCSPDGCLQDVDGLLSLKCPKSATHLRYLRGGAMPMEYVPQMLHELWISGAAFYDFLSFDDRFPDELQTFFIRVQRVDAAVAEYEKKVLAFLAEVDREYEAVQTLANLPRQLSRASEAHA